MASQNDLDKAYIDIACRWAKMSHGRRLKVGCIVVKDNQIISDGFNGTPSRFDNNCEYQIQDPNDKSKFVLKTKPEVIHAESNAITKLARSTNSSVGSTMYLTCNPCFECTKLIIQAGIVRVVYKDDYRLDEEIMQKSLVTLKRADIIVEKI